MTSWELISIPTEDFPADDVGHGFDNIGDVLTLSPLLMERYLDAAETISKRVIAVNPAKPSVPLFVGRYLQPNNAKTSQGRFRKMDPTAKEPVHSGPFTASGGYLKFSADAGFDLSSNVVMQNQKASLRSKSRCSSMAKELNHRRLKKSRNW